MTQAKAELLERMIARANAEGRNIAGEAAERAWREIRRNGDRSARQRKARVV
jgi:hypothetical protein